MYSKRDLPTGRELLLFVRRILFLNAGAVPVGGKLFVEGGGGSLSDVAVPVERSYSFSRGSCFCRWCSPHVGDRAAPLDAGVFLELSELFL